MAPNTKSVTLLILSDTHSFHRDFSHLSSLAASYPPVDILLHTGDLTNVGAPEELEHALHFLSLIPAELKLVIAGNHDVTLDKEYCSQPNKRGLTLDDHARARAQWIGLDSAASKAGITYLEEGTHSFTLRCGVRFTVHASPYQPSCGDWAFGYPWSFDRWTSRSSNILGRTLDYLTGRTDRISPAQAASPIPSWPKVDVLATHGPARGVLDRTRMGDERGCEHLRKAVERARPRLHCFGHIHEGRGVLKMTWPSLPFSPREKAVTLLEEDDGGEAASVIDLTEEGGKGVVFGRETVFVNAAIRDGSNRIGNRPWVVKLDLPVAEDQEQNYMANLVS